MAVRRRSTGSRSKGIPRWLMLLLGLGIGIAAVLLAQMLKERGVGLQNVIKVFSSSDKKTDEKKKDADAKPAKPKFDFYTILPETETVLPEKTPAKPKAKPKPESRPETAKSAPEPGVSYMLQAASFATFPEADQLKARLALSGLGAQIQKVSIEGRGDYYRVRLGPFSKIEELDSATQQLQQIGLKPIRLKVKRKAPDASLLQISRRGRTALPLHERTGKSDIARPRILTPPTRRSAIATREGTI